MVIADAVKGQGMDEILNVKQVAIVGTGLLGASLGLALKQRGFRGQIVGVGRRQTTLDEAITVGAIDCGVTDLVSVLPDTNLLVLAVPLSGFDSIFQTIAGHEHDRLIITDVGSTKVSVQQAAETHLKRPELFVGAHPMAGSEKQGPDAANPDLFQGKPCIICPPPEVHGTISQHAVEQVTQCFAFVGMKTLTMSPQEHDLQTAVTSHLPHAVSAMLIQTAMELGGWDVASTGFAGATRLASSNPPMRRDIMLANREALIQAMDAMTRNMARLKSLLEQGDRDELENMLKQSKQRRDDWLEQKD